MKCINVLKKLIKFIINKLHEITIIIKALTNVLVKIIIQVMEKIN
jgi:hypothetical protein